jgi:hypothetical protein
VIVGQIGKECIAGDNTLERYLALVRRMENYFNVFLVAHIDQSKNTKANELAKVATKKISLPNSVLFQTLEDSLVKNN